MKIREGFILRKMNDMNIVVAVGKAVKEFNGYISLNETGVFLWEHLVKGCSTEDLITNLLDNYDVDKEQATADVTKFILELKKSNLLED